MPGGNFYRYVAEEKPWDDAREAAKARELFGAKGYLSNITDENENNFVAEKTSAKNIWIGGSDEGHEGIWKWMDGPEDEAGMTFWCFDTETIEYPHKTRNDREASNKNRLFSNWDFNNDRR